MAGVVFFFGILTYLVIKRESLLIMDLHVERSASTAHLLAGHLIEEMSEGKSDKIKAHLALVNDDPLFKAGVLGPDGTAAFGTEVSAPEGIFRAGKDAFIRTGGELKFYTPIPNEQRCHGCHSPTEKTRGMLVITSSLKKANAEIEGTGKRIVLFAVLLGLLSELFLVVLARKFVIKPLAALADGTEALESERLHYRVDIKSKDEMGALASAFNQMAGQIESHRHTLQTEVEKRTKELKAIAEFSSGSFKGDIPLSELIGRALGVVVERFGYRYAVLCLIDRETGVLSQEFKKGIENGLCAAEIPLHGDHPFAKAVREAGTSVKPASEVGLPESFGTAAIIPILSHERKRCRTVNLCAYNGCPAFDSPDERCWLIKDTLCRSPKAVAGKEKIYGCLYCDVFPVLGVLVAGNAGEVSSLYSLEILASEIASAVENRRYIESKKQDIMNLIRLHDISAGKIQKLEMPELMRAVTESAAIFTGADSTAFYTIDMERGLRLAESHNIDAGLLPGTVPRSEGLLWNAVSEERAIETLAPEKVEHLRETAKKHGFLYAAAVPVIFEDSIKGVLLLFKKRDFYMTDSEKALMMLFASRSAAAIETASLYNALRAEKELSDAVFSNMPMGIMTLDNLGRINRVNRVGFEILRLTDYVVGGGLDEVLPGAGEFLDIRSAPGRELELKLGDAAVPIGFNNAPLFDAGGERAGTVVAFRDLTEIRKLQVEVRIKQHYEAMGKVIAGVAHEIRNPLFGISSLVQIIEKEAVSEEHRALLQAVSKEIQRMKNLIEELLLYSRPSLLNMKDIDLALFFEKFRHYVGSKGEGATLNMDVPFSLSVRGDEDKLTQVFLNLLDNAVNAGAKNISIAAFRENDKAAVSIEDDGHGIKEEHIGKVFEPFFTTKREGTGLGLAVCRKLIEEHGGYIEAESPGGKGTKITLRGLREAGRQAQ